MKASVIAYFTCSKLIYSLVGLSMLSTQLEFNSLLSSGSLSAGQVLPPAATSSLCLVEHSSLFVGR